MANDPVEEYTARWEDRWQRDHTPWDLGEPAPILVKMFESGDIASSEGLALVPGCGRGYEVTWIGSFKNWRAIGLDISQKASQKAIEVLILNSVSRILFMSIAQNEATG